MNRLSKETSPYLLQHAHNPVDWFAWGQEALQKAIDEDKPILVSIGYSACHWCHVMERESFEIQAIAEIMNQHFVCIKVDREERPDVDAIYMDALQSMGIHGGWPLNVFLLPDGKPFYGGTYFPPTRRHGQPSWVDVCMSIAQAYKNPESKTQLQQSAEGFTQNMQFGESEKYGLLPEKDQFTIIDLDKMFDKISNRFDTLWGGVGDAPKFPMPSIYQFLLKYYNQTKSEKALEQVNLTLKKMALGGIYDQLGGGFSRYSVDGEWFAPHFEKMLYDNGQLLSLYAAAYRLTKEPLYKAILEETILWVKREMTSPEFAFYAALDADSEGVEGKFYTWTKAEIDSVLDEDSAPFCQYYQVTVHGNWEEGVNILWSKDESRKVDFKESKEKLLSFRSKRIRPGLDDKILTSWNGLMLKGLIDTYNALGDESILDLAIKNAQFLNEKMTSNEGYLWHSYKSGEAKIMGYLEDYAALISAYTALYQATFQEKWLHEAEKLTLYVWQNFWDEEDQLFYFTDVKGEKLIARKKELFDNVIPASNSMIAQNFYDLGLLLDREDFTNVATHLLSKVKKILLTNVDYMTNWASLATKMIKPTAQIAIVGENCLALRKELASHFLPNAIILGTKTESNLPLLEDKMIKNGETLIFVCQNKTCLLPVKTVEEALRMI